MPSFISHKYKLIFCHIPRTAGTSFYEAIEPYLGAKDEVDTFPKHTPLRYFNLGRQKPYFDEYLKVSILRNESDRLKSLEVGAKSTGYVDLKSEYWWTAEEWLRDKYSGKMLADILICFDKLPESALKFFKLIGIELEVFPHLNER